MRISIVGQGEQEAETPPCLRGLSARIAWLRQAAILVAVLMGLGWAGEAKAGCGLEHVVSARGSDAPRSTHGFTFLPSYGAVHADGSRDFGRPSAPTGECRGPMCSRNSGVPSGASQAVVRTLSLDWAVLAQPAPCGEENSYLFGDDEMVRPSAAVVDMVFHPPRSGEAA